jgi:selenocysteine-specific elongation factor
VLRFESPVQAPLGALVIGSRLDGDVHGDACRLAFHGRLVCDLGAVAAPPAASAGGGGGGGSSSSSEEHHYLRPLRLYKRKLKSGVVDRVESSDGAGVAVIGRGLFKKEVDMNQFAGLRVVHAGSGWEGSIEGAFGKAGKFKAFFRAGEGSGSGGAARVIKPGDALTLRYKKYLYGAESQGKARLEQGV